ncbi:hypothetical protein CAPTEDRAFT_211623 [Capitella teleta]|uniref:EF-hand domain-containing protein n=1 Tax=Capitella teleta TaxID=283909 RepID=R7UMQ7_CAPTE|nr:hypothetical protein CAPTEDRAFT_211623 [Capitella teleta]|eukprot:ELU05212.1 hypothetical protein CAPTEDRAFT_211623 [Capitella teleta]
MSVAEVMYSKIDSDGSGSIDQSEWDAIFKTFDKDGSGTCDEAEWVAGFTAVFGGSADSAKKAFSKLDTDKSGDISIAEICDFFKKMDDDGNGSISKDEFVGVWSKNDAAFFETHCRFLRPTFSNGVSWSTEIKRAFSVSFC